MRLLVVEDHPPTAMVMRRLLEHEGYCVRVVRSCRDALQTAAQWMPDVLISDMVLPDKDGTELIKTLRKAHPQLQGITVSGHVNAETIERSRELGFAEHLCKPITSDRLLAAIHRLTERMVNVEYESAVQMPIPRE